MELSVKCPKCGEEAWVVFEPNSGRKLIKCRCGNIAPATDLSFKPSPKFLFKYRPHDLHSESWIVYEELFFASPALFNDPFDSKVFYTMEGTNEQKKKYLSEIFQAHNPDMKKRARWRIIKKTLDKQILEKDYESHVKKIQERIDSYGVVSFSRKSDDLLMFSYYAKDHTGYCLKYKRAEENILSMAREINYELSYPRFSVFDFRMGKLGSLGDKVLLTKAKCWEHEAEWRNSFAGCANRVIKSPHPILDGIILGCNMTSEHRAEIIALNKRRAKPVEIFQARKRKFEFALEIDSLG